MPPAITIDLEFLSVDGARRHYHGIDLANALVQLDSFDWNTQLRTARREGLNSPSICLNDIDHDRQLWASAVSNSPLRFLVCLTRVSDSAQGVISGGHLLGDVREAIRAFYVADDASIRRMIEVPEQQSWLADDANHFYIFVLLLAALCTLFAAVLMVI